MKIFRHRNLMGCIYALLMAIPFVAVAVKCAYVVVNKNAKDSYYGETINEEIETQVNYNDLQPNTNYLFRNTTTTNKPENANMGYMYVSNVVNVNGFLNNIDLSNTYQIRFYLDTVYNTFFFQDINGTNIAQFGLNNGSIAFTFDYLGYSTNYTGFSYADYFYKVSYNKYSYLDNVFYYAIDEVTNNEIGNIHFFDWFSNMFLSDNATNNRFVGYVNWYMNYALLVSCAFILFLVLMWMINFARRLLERGMNYDF